MRRRKLMAFLVVAFAVLVSATVTAQASAAGYWNMPGTHAQRAGHGYGGGYHAPLILGPVQCDGWEWGAPVRLPFAPVPYYGCGSCGDCGRMVEAPSSMESLVPVAPAAAATPAAVAPVEAQNVERPAATGSGDVSLHPEPVASPPLETVAKPVRPLFDAPVQP
jgi:hypothetical protein